MRTNPSKYTVFSSTNKYHCFILYPKELGPTRVTSAFFDNDTFWAITASPHETFILGDCVYTDCYVLELQLLRNKNPKNIEARALAEFLRLAEENSWMELLK